ncbi:nuclear transport factor 2 family protein [Dyella sp. 20L07]|uniref:nuclear transport factor 2 family protein n=1 Tax=Dyella sp. 20L07 TaxID=3384240 RepID=UPI003D288543
MTANAGSLPSSIANDPAAVVQRQLEAYNDKNVDAWLATYATDAEQYLLHGDRLAKGHEELRSRIQLRFAEPDLHARLLSRVVMGPVVVDLEEVTRNFPDGKGVMEMLCVYEVVQGCIVKASFAMGTPVLRH